MSNKKTFAEKIESWSDERCLEAVTDLLQRIDIDTRFAMDEEGLITHQMLVIGAGPLVIISDPKELDWPLQRLPIPDALAGLVDG